MPEREGLHGAGEHEKKEVIQVGWQSEAIKEANISGAELARRMKPAFPAISKAAVSLAMRPAETGVTFTPSANKTVAVVTGYARPRQEKRRCPVRIQARVTEAQARAFNAARAAMGHATVNDALVYALMQYIAEAKKKAAANSATVRDGKGKYPVTSITSKEAVVNVQT